MDYLFVLLFCILFTNLAFFPLPRSVFIRPLGRFPSESVFANEFSLLLVVVIYPYYLRRASHIFFVIGAIPRLFLTFTFMTWSYRELCSIFIFILWRACSSRLVSILF